MTERGWRENPERKAHGLGKGAPRTAATSCTDCRKLVAPIDTDCRKLVAPIDTDCRSQLRHREPPRSQPVRTGRPGRPVGGRLGRA